MAKKIETTAPATLAAPVESAPAAPVAAPVETLESKAAALLAKREGAPNGAFKYGVKRGTPSAFIVCAGYNAPAAHKGLRAAIEHGARLAGVETIEPGVTVLSQAALVCGAHAGGLLDLGYLWGSYVRGTDKRAKGKLGPDGLVKPEMLRAAV